MGPGGSTPPTARRGTSGPPASTLRPAPPRSRPRNEGRRNSRSTQMPEVESLPHAPAKAPASAARKTPQPGVDYGGQSVQNIVVSVRGFRLMVGLMLVNTVLIASTVLGPQLFPFLRGQ